MSDAFFVPEGEGFVPTAHPVGPWSPDALHGGPVAALFVHALTRIPAGPPRWPARVHVEFLRPVPCSRLDVETRLQEGRTVVRWDAVMRSKGADVARASGVWVPAVATPEIASAPEDSGPSHEQGAPDSFRWPIPWDGYHRAVDIRMIRGTLCDGPVRVWMRPLFPLVAGAPSTGLERALICADAGSGISAVLDPRQYNFVNPDLDVATWRAPDGDWVGLDAITRVGPDKVAACETSLFDSAGPFGRASQVLVVRGVRG